MIKIFELKPNRSPNSLSPLNRVLNIEIYDKNQYESYTFNADRVLSVNVQLFANEMYYVCIVMEGNSIEISNVDQKDVPKISAAIWGARVTEKLY